MSELSDHPALAAAQKGLIVVLPSPRELLIDVDTDASAAQVIAMLAVFATNGVTFTETKRRRSAGGNTHVYLEIPPDWPDLEPITRVALQACFGSDLTREALSLLRIFRRYDIPPTCFFEVPDDWIKT